MARNVTLLSLRTQAKQRADMVNSSFVSDSEWNSYINASATELYDILVSAYADYYVSTGSLSILNGTDTYSLPTDFYKLLGVDLVIDANGNAVTLKPYNLQQRNAFLFTPTWNTVGLAYLRYHMQGQSIKFVPMPTTAQTVRILYVPALATLSGDSDTLDGVDGWEEFIVIDSAIKAKQKQEDDVGTLQGQKGAIIRRITEMAANRDAGSPEVVRDVTKSMPAEFWSFDGGGN